MNSTAKLLACILVVGGCAAPPADSDGAGERRHRRSTQRALASSQNKSAGRVWTTRDLEPFKLKLEKGLPPSAKDEETLFLAARSGKLGVSLIAAMLLAVAAQKGLISKEPVRVLVIELCVKSSFASEARVRLIGPEYLTNTAWPYSSPYKIAKLKSYSLRTGELSSDEQQYIKEKLGEPDPKESHSGAVVAISKKNLNPLASRWLIQEVEGKKSRMKGDEREFWSLILEVVKQRNKG